VVFAASVIQKALLDVSPVDGYLFRVGVCHKRILRVEVGDALVGLQRAFPESERAHLPAGGSAFRAGGHDAKLLSDAFLFKAVSQNPPRMETDFVRHFSDSVHSGYHLLRRQP